MPARTLHEPSGLSDDQEMALLAIEQAMDAMKAHGDALSQWRLLQIERALAALDRGLHRTALELVGRAMTPFERVAAPDRAAAARLERRLEIEQLRARLAALRGGRRTRR